MRNVIMFIILFGCIYSNYLYSQENKFYKCDKHQKESTPFTDSMHVLIDSILSSEIGDSYLFRFLESCDENAPEYGFQFECVPDHQYVVKSFQFSFDVWTSLIQENKDLCQVELLTKTDTIGNKLIEPFLDILNMLYSKQSEFIPLMMGGSCYEFYYNRKDSIICGSLRDPGGPTALFVGVMNKMSDLKSPLNEVELLNQLNTILFKLENNYMEIQDYKY